MDTGDLSVEVGRPERKIYTPPPGVEIKKERYCTSTLPYYFVAFSGITLHFEIKHEWKIKISGNRKAMQVN
jgi:hypothetical protein